MPLVFFLDSFFTVFFSYPFFILFAGNRLEEPFVGNIIIAAFAIGMNSGCEAAFIRSHPEPKLHQGQKPPQPPLM
jgi:hypothetical protein